MRRASTATHRCSSPPTPPASRSSMRRQGASLAWESIIAEQEHLNLAPQQVRQAETQREVAATEMTTRIPETYRWLLVPVQSDTHGAVSWDALNLTGADPLAVRASRRLRAQDGLMTAYGATLLRMELDRVPLWRGDHVSVSQLARGFRPLPVPAPAKRPGGPAGAQHRRWRVPDHLGAGNLRLRRELRRRCRTLSRPTLPGSDQLARRKCSGTARQARGGPAAARRDNSPASKAGWQWQRRERSRRRR